MSTSTPEPTPDPTPQAGGDIAPAPEPAIVEVDVTYRIRRFDPDVSERHYWQDFSVRSRPTDRILDGLHQIKGEQDGTLINGRNRLACKTLIKDLNASKPITIEPIKGLTVEKDLIVDMDPFFEAYRAVKPFLITNGEQPTLERVQSVEQRAAFDDTTKCILCAACTTSCPVYWTDDQYFGPAAIVNAHRFIFDSRDDGTTERLKILNQSEGPWRCRTTFNCTDACPRGIEVTTAIQQVKRATMFGADRK